jgi:Transposase IS200 like
MRRYRLGSHARYDLKVHLVWVPKYRKRVLTGAVAVRARDLLRQIAAENDLQIISGKVAADHVHLFLSYRAHQNISQIVQWLRVGAVDLSGLAGPPPAARDVTANASMAYQPRPVSFLAVLAPQVTFATAAVLPVGILQSR